MIKLNTVSIFIKLYVMLNVYFWFTTIEFKNMQ